jgi:hypothetical protein
MKLRPVTLADAKAFVSENHRHNKPPLSWKFGVGLECEGRLIGVAMAGRPVARALDVPGALEVTRVCTLGERNANSMLYGAIARAARALGYVVLYTYTLVSESGTSLKASGWTVDACLEARKGWDAPSRPRNEELWPSEGKYRWIKRLT